MENSTRENSTEKLLDAIRGPGHKSPQISISKDSSQISQLVNLKTIKKKTLNLGILINKEEITFALTVEKGVNKRKFLIKWANIKIPEGIGVEDEGFSTFLELNLNEFTEGHKSISIWCVIDSAHLKFRNIIIPNLSQSKIANAAFWGLKKEIDFNADNEIFNYDIIGDITEEGLKKKKILALTAEKHPVNSLKMLFSKTNYTLEGITAIPFAIQNFIFTHHIQAQDSPFTIVNLSRENTEMFCFSDSGILLARKIRTDLFEASADYSGKNLIEFISSEKKFQRDNFSPAGQSCERLIDKILRTGEYCSQNFADHAPMKKYIFMGEAEDCEPFMDFVTDTISVDVEKFKPVFDDLPGTIEVTLPQNALERGRVILAFSIALSSNEYTPNFIYTYLDKLKKIKERYINTAAAIAFVIFFLTCAGFSSYQEKIQKQEADKLEALIQQKNKFGPGINQEKTFQLIDAVKHKLNSRQQYISDYLPLAIINEICYLTPEIINISSFEADFNKLDPKNKQTKKAMPAKVMITGTIASLENDPESDLTGYILRLEDSQSFGNIEIVQRNIDEENMDTGLNFKLTMDYL